MIPALVNAADGPGSELSPLWRGVALVLAFIMLGTAILGLQRRIDASYPHRRVENLLYLPSGRFLKPAVLGYRSLASDLLWLKSISYFGGHFLRDKQYRWLAHILDLVTELDPHYATPYWFGGIVLANEAGSVEDSNRLIEKGIRNLPTIWKFPFLLGFNQFYFQGDLEAAAAQISRAAQLPGHPEYLPRLAASLYARANRVEDAIAFLQTMRDSVGDEGMRQNLQQKIDELRSGRVPQGLERIMKERGLK